MKVEFKFNGATQISLIPEDAREKQLLQLAFLESDVKLVSSPNPEHMVIECVKMMRNQG